MQKYIDSAVEQFRTLITEQLERQNEMEKGAAVKDFANADKIVIGICGGDGIGPVITAASQRVLEYLLADEIKSGRIKINITWMFKKLYSHTNKKDLRKQVFLVCITRNSAQNVALSLTNHFQSCSLDNSLNYL